ncbi:unnamed protein product [Owenia fusiformis]|uniref:Uncharacterized protein n=1 Tax=Owenia fusiformis TaxID=6347 RepID=A0A8J1U3V6_OWEFU|nr:unnamed protein product [Owenia fusiformis]
MIYSNIIVAATLLVAIVMAKQPNIVIMVADDLGMGDVGCFGNGTINTPNIDRIAKEGAKLTQHLTAEAICTPSRAAMLTGRYPIRSGMASRPMARVHFVIASAGGLPPEEITFAELAKQAGYKTAAYGKWHLGLHSYTTDFSRHPNNQGFDDFYGIGLTNMKDFGDDPRNKVIHFNNPNFDRNIAISLFIGIVTSLLVKKYSTVAFVVLLTLSLAGPLTLRFVIFNFKMLNSVLYRNLEIVEQPVRLNGVTQRLVTEAKEFLAERNSDGTPFLLYLPWLHTHDALFSAPEFRGKSRHGFYGDNIEELDWGVGEILNTLDQYKMTDDTFVYFTSDNGGHVENHDPDGRVEGGYNGIYRGGKMQGGMDGGIRVPTAARFPGIIPPGIEIDQPTALMDMLPTLASLMGMDVPKDRQIDGKDLLPLLKGGKSDTPVHEFLVHYCGQVIHAARYTPEQTGGINTVWKAHFALPNWVPGTEGCAWSCACYDVTWQNPPVLYNIAQDPSERQPVDPTTDIYKQVMEKINKGVEKHKQSIIPPETNQYSIPRMWWLPWLQPCCNFPYCSCTDPKYS